MSDLSNKLLSAFEGHDVESLRSALAAGADACAPIRGKTPVNWLLEEYHRTDRLTECLDLLFYHGATLDDEMLRPVLLNDADGIKEAFRQDSHFGEHRTSLRSAFASLIDVTALHVAAEYGHFEAAEALVVIGADVNARAGVNELGLNGHTPIFHTVNSNANRSRPILELLLDAGARCDIRVDGLEWGKGFDWETIFFDVTPISFAQMGLMPQVHRRESDIYENIELMLIRADRPSPPFNNVPNKYLSK